MCEDKGRGPVMVKNKDIPMLANVLNIMQDVCAL